MIRRLEKSDSEVYFKFRLHGLELHPESFGSGAKDFSKATNEQIKALLSKPLIEDFVLGAFVENELAGVIGFKREPKLAVSHKGTVWGLFVHPDHRGSGLAKSLLSQLIKVSSENTETEYLRALVTTSNSNAVKLFESAGFKKYGLEEHGIKVGSEYYDQAYLKLDFKK